DVPNNMGFLPLHIAALLDNRAVAADLIRAGASVDTQGPSGYTALHISSELNHPGIVADLVFNGARKGLKTVQGLTAGSIARIQGNNDLARLISRRDSGMIGLTVKGSVIESSDNLNE